MDQKRPPESAKSWFMRKAFGLYPCYRRTGVRIAYISPDVLEVHVRLPLNWKTRGYNGTLFGGSMYASIDPLYMTMISWHLGRKYVVWDRTATVDFRKAGRSTLHARAILEPGSVDAMRAELETEERIERVYDIALVDEADVVHAAFTKTIVIRKSKPKS